MSSGNVTTRNNCENGKERVPKFYIPPAPFCSEDKGGVSGELGSSWGDSCGSCGAL